MSSASCGEKKRLSRPRRSSCVDLLGDAPLQRPVELRELPALLRLPVVQALLLQARADPRLQQHRLERLAEIVLGAELDAAHDAVELVQRRDHEHRDVAPGGIGLEALEHRVAVEVRHHDVEEHEVHRRRRLGW